MRWFLMAFLFSLSAVVAMAQVAVAPAPVPVPPVPVPISYGFSNSVIDHNGRVLVFDTTYSYTYPPILDVQPVAVRFPPTMTTRVTVIASDASSPQEGHYNGTFQIVGVGRYAVYAIITNYGIVSTSGQSLAATRQLVALGPAFPTLVPTDAPIDVPFSTSVKVSSVGDDGAPDTIALVPNIVIPLTAVSGGTIEPLPAIPSQPRTVQMYTFDGKSNSFTPLRSVVLSNP